MKARVGTLAVGTRFDTLLTGRRGVVRAQSSPSGETAVEFYDRSPLAVKYVRPDLVVRVVEVTH